MTEKQYKQIEMLYLEMRDKLMFIALKNEESESLAEEAVQETFRIACQEAEKCCNSPNPQGWLVNTLYNVICNAKRKRANAKRLIEEYLALQIRESYVSEDRLNVEILYQNVAGLEEFKLLSEMAVEGMSHKEMARRRNISVSACKKRVQRAREILQMKMKIDVTK